jgi:hypothetical protein
MSHNKLPIIQSLWLGNELSVMEQLCITSFIKNGHEFHLYIYDDIKNIPEKTVVNDASKIISPDRIFKNKVRDTYAAFSDIFRYKLILEKGNYWVDTDVICILPFDDKSKYVFAQCKQSKFWSLPKSTLDVESCVLKAPQGSEIMEYCYNQSIKKNPDEILWEEIGPELLKTEIKNFGLNRYVNGTNIFCPIDWREWRSVISSSIITTSLVNLKMSVYGSKAVHLWNEMWRIDGIDKNESFHKRSIYEQLKKRYMNKNFHP